MTKLLTVKEAAEYLRVSQGWVARALLDGLIPSVKLGDSKKSRRLVRQSDLEKYIANNVVEH